MLGEIVGGDEGRDMGPQAVQIVVVEDLDCGVLFIRSAWPLSGMRSAVRRSRTVPGMERMIW